MSKLLDKGGKTFTVWNQIGSYCHWGLSHDDVIKLKHFPRYWPYVREIHRSPVNSPHKGLWRGALMFSVKCVWIKSWINNREAGDLRRDRAHYDVMNRTTIKTQHKYHNMLNPPIKRCFSNETFENQHKIVQSYRITFIFIQDATSVTEFKSLLSKWTESTFQCGCSIFMSTLNYFNNFQDFVSHLTYSLNTNAFILYHALFAMAISFLQ